MPVGVTAQSQSIYDLHMLTFWVCVAIGVIVYSVMGYSLIAYRRRSAADKPAQFSHNTKLEWLWTTAAALVLVALAVPSTRTLMEIYDTTPGEVNIKVTGYQWKWGYEYLDEGFSFVSNSTTLPEEISGDMPKGEHYLLTVDEPIYVPIRTKVRFLITARDVLHAFWVPDFGIKQDAIPGYFNTAWVYIKEAGVYRGVCAELCGLNHGFMPIVVVAVEEDEYRDWVGVRQQQQARQDAATARSWSRESLVEQGRLVYLQNCAVCHQPTGAGIPGAFPALDGSKVVVGEREALINTVLNGVPGTSMQPFAELLSASDLAAVLTYTRTSWGNEEKMKDEPVVQPTEVLNLMEGK